MNSDTTEMPPTSGVAAAAGLRDIDIGGGRGGRRQFLRLRASPTGAARGALWANAGTGKAESQRRQRRGDPTPEIHQQTSSAPAGAPRLTMRSLPQRWPFERGRIWAANR